LSIDFSIYIELSLLSAKIIYGLVLKAVQLTNSDYTHTTNHVTCNKGSKILLYEDIVGPKMAVFWEKKVYMLF